ncbi:MAG TPA: cytochrome c [Acidobacteriaceae bacterium]|nr:cytochrome c [Acidobacteriaceae bacterium]
MMRPASILLCALCLVPLACKREQRIFDPGSVGAQVADGTALNSVSAAATPPRPSISKFEDNAYAVSEGKRLYSAYNCAGCHSVGGGGAIGPALSDAEWIYGSRPDQIFSTIVQGRPNGMPSFSGKLPDYQVWELVAYVRSLSGQLPSDIAPARSDTMAVAKAEQARKKEHPADENEQPIEHPEHP